MIPNKTKNQKDSKIERLDVLIEKLDILIEKLDILNENMDIIHRKVDRFINDSIGIPGKKSTSQGEKQ